MYKRSLLVLGLLAGGGTLYAQQAVVGQATEVKGLVTVSDGSSVANVALGSPVIDGSRYVTSSSGSVTLRLDNDCDIVLKPSETVTIKRERGCAALLASVQSLTGNNVLLAGLTPLLGLSSVLTAAVLDPTLRSRAISGQ
jgi:hypothetical protein